MSIFSSLAQEVFGYMPKVVPADLDIAVSPKNFGDWYRNTGMPEEVVSVWVLFEYQDLSQILKKWKYGGNTNSEVLIGNAFEAALYQLPVLWKNPSIAYVPLGFDRWFERWFNQSKHLSYIVHNTLKSPLFHGIYRLWSGKHQAWISKNERIHRNFTFGILPFSKVPEEIILVDDVISTGTTLRACTRYLIQNGCKKIFIVALARSS